MKYIHSSKHGKICRHDPDTRAQLGFRLRHARLRLGWSMGDAGKYFQVTERTWHNWENGSHRIPFAVYKLLRVLARYELPDDAWAGWRFDGGQLITPEGRQIAPTDGAWWSLLVRQAAGFRAAYDEACGLRRLVGVDLVGPAAPVSEAQLTAGAAGAGLVPSKTSLQDTDRQPVNSSQNDVIMQSWPTLYDFPTPSTLPPEPKPSTSGFPLTPSFASPWTPTYARPVMADLASCVKRPGTPAGSQPHLKQVGNQPGPVSLSSSHALKSRPSMKPRNGNEKPYRDTSAMPAAANAAKLASAARGTP